MLPFIHHGMIGTFGGKIAGVCPGAGTSGGRVGIAPVALNSDTETESCCNIWFMSVAIAGGTGGGINEGFMLSASVEFSKGSG